MQRVQWSSEVLTALDDIAAYYNEVAPEACDHVLADNPARGGRLHRLHAVHVCRGGGRRPDLARLLPAASLPHLLPGE